MLVITAVAGDTRVLREAGTLALSGHAVHVIGRDVPEHWQPPPGVTVSSAAATSVLRRAGVPTGTGRRLSRPARAARWLLLPRHRASATATWCRAARAEAAGRDFDVVHAHDFNTLALGAELAQARGAALVYDSHELWCGRPRVGRPTPLLGARERRTESVLGRRADAVITVGQGVADALHTRCGLRAVHVVRNSFPAADPPPARPLPSLPSGAVYAGRIAPYREVETVLAAARHDPRLRLTLVGPADTTYLASLDTTPVRVLPSRPVEQVDDLLRQAGLALVTHSDRWENHRLAMPNKLFHAVRAGVPVVATDVGELARTVRAHGLGTLYPPGDATALAAAVTEAGNRYAELVANVRAAAPALSWERDAAVLTGLYQRLAEHRPHRPTEQTHP